MASSVMIYDTTLRDGSQGEGVSFTVADKLEIVRRLDELRVDYIEGGWPGSNDKDLEFFYQLKGVRLSHSKVVAFTSTRKKYARIEEDQHMKDVLGTGLSHCAVFGKTWDFQVRQALRTELSENLKMITDTIVFLKEKGIEAIFDAEHFFDGYKDNPAYALAALAAARDAGADWLVLCDTNGGAMPHEIADIVQEVVAAGFSQIGIHAHNDGGLAVANSLAAVRAGATQVQGTINGIGERCGNADLCAVLPNLVLKARVDTHFGERGVRSLKSLSERLYGMTGKTPVAQQPFVGRSAFAHKAGVHVSAIRRDPRLYEHIAPELLGNERRILLSELSGVSNVLFQLERMGLTADEATVARILARLKTGERDGQVYEEAPTSLWLLIREELGLCAVSVLRVDEWVQQTPNGFAVRLYWRQDGEGCEAQGTGLTVGTAMCEALALSGNFTLSVEEVSPVQVDTHVTTHRARVRGAYQGQQLATAGLGETPAAAMACAVLQIYQYMRITSTVAALS
ncbi:MAG: citramalate synthase [Firmicutes bacterium]|nr:citramalate synthase [Bacillota bacterium]